MPEEEVDEKNSEDGSDEPESNDMGSLPKFELSDGPEVPVITTSTTSLMREMEAKGFFEDVPAVLNRVSGSVVVQNVSNYGLISEKIVNQMMRESGRLNSIS